jgi:hypothetical protein
MLKPFKTFLKVGVVSCSLILVCACAHQTQTATAVSGIEVPRSLVSSEPVQNSDPVRLELKAQAGAAEEVSYKMHSEAVNLENGEKRLDQEEKSQFTVLTQTLQATSTNLVQALTARDKEGALDLHTMALPEIGERMQMELNRKGEILNVDQYPKQSIFYVPQISLPDGPVVVGDTWAMQSSWLSLDGNFPFVMDMISILKDFYDCSVPAAGGGSPIKDKCADVELSGEVSVAPQVAREVLGQMTFKNDWRGRMLFAVNSGVVVWSRVDSTEDYQADNNSRNVQTVLETQLTNLSIPPK